jgi:hypothetical protein
MGHTLKQLFLNLIILIFLSPLVHGAVVVGTNCGFVSSVPTADPDTSLVYGVDDYSWASKFTSPATAALVSGMGWWCDAASDAANFEVGIYSHDAGNNKPNLRLFVSDTNAKGIDAGWKNVSSLSWSISASTVYWIAFQCDNTGTPTYTNRKDDASYKMDYKQPNETTLSDPWGTSKGTLGVNITVYALWAAASGYGNVLISEDC